MTDALFSNAPRQRLDAARSLSDGDRRRLLESFAVPDLYKPWPRGMPSVANPLLVVIGVSPGNAPQKNGPAFLEDYTPTFGSQPPGFRYPDTRYYWDKIRALSTGLVRLWDPTLSEQECLALTSHLNLGTEMAGRASRDAVQLDVVRWVSDLIVLFHARVVVGLGLVGLLTGKNNADVRDAWNEGALRVDWLHAEVIQRESFRFRRLAAVGAEGRVVQLLLWHNHPSKAPFAGRALIGGHWDRSVGAGIELLRELIC